MLNRKKLAVVALIAVLTVSAGWLVYFSPTPWFGDPIRLRTEMPLSVKLVMNYSAPIVITEPERCAEVLRCLETARGGGEMCECKSMGKLSLHYSDGATVDIGITSAQRWGRLELAPDGKNRYWISRRLLLDSFNGSP